MVSSIFRPLFVVISESTFALVIEREPGGLPLLGILAL